MQDIQKRVAGIAKRAQWDNEMAHVLEDGLYIDFVQHVAANGPTELAAMAKEVLKTRELSFDRWYA